MHINFLSDLIGRCRHRFEANVQTDLEEMGCEDVGSIHVAASCEYGNKPSIWKRGQWISWLATHESWLIFFTNFLLCYPSTESCGRVGNTHASDSGVYEFKSWPGTRISRVTFLVIFLSVSRQISGQCIKLYRDLFLLYPFQSIIRTLAVVIRHYIIEAIDSIVK
jgi:hypothetical protein